MSYVADIYLVTPGSDRAVAPVTVIAPGADPNRGWKVIVHGSIQRLTRQEADCVRC